MLQKLLAYLLGLLANKGTDVGPLGEGPRSGMDPKWDRLAECLRNKRYVEREERRQLEAAAYVLMSMSVVWWCACKATETADSSASAPTMFICSIGLLLLLGLTKPGHQARASMMDKARDKCRGIAANQQPVIPAATLDLVFKQSVVLLRLPQRMCHEF